MNAAALPQKKTAAAVKRWIAKKAGMRSKA